MNLTLQAIESFFEHRQRKEIVDPSLQPASILVPIFCKDEALSVVLIKRSMHVEHHKGQISFPGGVREPSDRSLIETALREAEEEIALPSSSVRVIGLLDDHWTPTGFCITPVVAFIDSLPPLSPHHHEVETIFDVPLSLFLDPTKERSELRNRAGTDIPIYFYCYGEHEIWGATAAIIRSFLWELRAFLTV